MFYSTRVDLAPTVNVTLSQDCMINLNKTKIIIKKQFTLVWLSNCKGCDLIKQIYAPCNSEWRAALCSFTRDTPVIEESQRDSVLRKCLGFGLCIWKWNMEQPFLGGEDMFTPFWTLKSLHMIVEHAIFWELTTCITWPLYYQT